jgi:hypothetical protein
MQRGVLTLPTTKAGGVQYIRLNEEARRSCRASFRGTSRCGCFQARTRPPMQHYLPTVNELGLTGVTWHTLRHTFVSRAAMAGVTEGTIASMLRHRGTAALRASEPPISARGGRKSSAFGKAEAKEPMKSERKQQPELMEAPEKAEAFTPIPTVPGNRKSCEVIEEL